MHHRDETNCLTKTLCGCQALLTGNPIRPYHQQQPWTDTLLLQDLENDLGPCNEVWFDDLTAQHEQRREAIPPNRQTGWSPCPAGGVVNVAASTPHRVKTTVQCDSPALWPALLTDSPTIDFLSTPHSKSASSEDNDHNNSTAVSFGFPLDGIKGSEDEEGREKGERGLLAFSMDNADLSWSSSMATPPNTAVDTFPVTEEEERQKGPARALFSPNTSAADSELGDMDFNTTIEQEEASLLLFAVDASHVPSPLDRDVRQGPCASCKKTERREKGGLHLRAKSCSCQHLRVPVVEIHDERTNAVFDVSSNGNAEESLHIQQKASLQDSLSDSPVLFRNNKERTADVAQRENSVMNCQVQKEIDLEDAIPGSPLQRKDSPSHCDLGEVKLRRRRTSTPRTPKFKSWSQVEKGHASDTALCTRRCSSLESTPVRRGNANLSSLVRKLDTSPVVTLSDPRVSKLAKGCVGWKSEDIPESSANKIVSKSENDGSWSPVQRASPGSVDSSCETEKATSLDEALADFFSSPETCARQRKHAPGKVRKRLSEVLGDSGEENPTMKTDSQASLSDTNLKNQRGDGTDSLAEDLGHVSEETRSVLSPSRKVNGISSRLAGKETLSERDGMCDVSERTPQKRSGSLKVAEEERNFVSNGSPPVPSPPKTPLSILRSSRKQRQVSSSQKRVHFAEDCKVKTLSKSKKRLVSIEAVGDENNPKSDVFSSDSCRERGSESEQVKNGEKNKCKKDGASAENKMVSSQQSQTLSSVQFVKISSSDRLQTTETCVEGSESGSKPQTLQQSKLHKEDRKTLPSAGDRTMRNNKATPVSSSADDVAKLHDHSKPATALKPPPVSSTTCTSEVKLKETPVSWTTCTSQVKLKETPVRNTDPLESSGVKSAAGVSSASAATEKQASWEHKGQDAVTPVRSVSQPKLRLGLKKTPRFMYPSSSQIMESCPQNVYCFKPAESMVMPSSSKDADKSPGTPAPRNTENSTSAAVKQPTNTNTADQAISNLSSPSVVSRTPQPPTNTNTADQAISNLSSPSVVSRTPQPPTNTNTADQAISNLSSPSVVSCTPQPPAFSKDPNCPTDTKVSGIAFQGSQSVAGTGTGLLPKVSMLEDEAMEEEPYWSDIEDSAVVEAGIIGQEEDLGNEILCDMDFSQELLSQSKIVTWDEDVDGSTHSNADNKVTDLKPQGKDNQTACEEESDEVVLGRPVEDRTSSETENPAEKTIEERTLNSLLPTIEERTLNSLLPTIEERTLDSLLPTIEERTLDSLLPNSDKTASLLEPVRAPNSIEPVSGQAFRQKFDKNIESAVQSNLCNEQAQGKVNSLLFAPARDFGGFSTAGGKSMVLSDKALNAAKALFQDEDMMNEESFKNDVKSTSDELLKLKGTSDSCEPLATFPEESQKRALDTGSKRVSAATEQSPSVSWGASEAAGMISLGYSDVKADEPQTEPGHTSLKTVYSATEQPPSTSFGATDAVAIEALSGFSGFKSARGKDFVLSFKGQRKAEDMWKAVESELQGNENIPDSGGQREAEDTWKVAEKGLQSNKNVSKDVSAGSSLTELQLTHTDEHSFPWKTKEQTGMVSQDSMETSSFSRARSVAESSSSSLPCDGMGFQTAGGKFMNLSSKAREKALALWESVGKEFVIPAEPLQDEPPLHSSRDPQEPSLTHKQPDVLVSEKVNDDVVKPETSCEKPKPATLKLVPPSNVPQGFRPFKAPTVLRKVTEEERYTLTEPEKPAEVQKNTLLNHFSNTRSDREIRVSKRRRSDEFSDDDEETWDIETMDVVCGEGKKRDYEQKAKPTSSHLKPGALEYESGKDSIISPQGPSEIHVKLEQKSAENERIHSVTVADDEMSDAVLSELTNDMYEATQSARTLQKPLHSLPTQSEKDRAKDSLLQVDVQFLKQFPSQDSQKSMNMNVSFDSLRCDDNVSYEEKDSAHGKVTSSSREKHDVRKGGEIMQSIGLGARESDFDSSILDLAADSTFSDENGQNESVQSDQAVDMDSSYVEKDALDISCMEKELDASHVEVSGGVVWMEKEGDNTDSKPDHNFLLTSLDALKEENSSGVIAEEGNSSTEADDLKELSTDTSFDANDSALLVLESACELSGVKNVLKRKAETSTNTADKRPRTEELPTDAGSKTVKTAKQNFIIEPPEEHDSKAETSPVDSLANVSWTDITSTFNPSQWGEDERGRREDANDQCEKIEILDSRMCPEQTLGCGGANGEVPVSACAVSLGNRKTAGNNFVKSIGVSRNCEKGFDEKSMVKTDAATAKGQGIPLKTSKGDLEKRDSTLANAEDFQITSGMSQFCSTQFSQVTKTEEHTGTGLQNTLQKALESRNASGEENRKPNAEDAKEASTSKVSMAEAHPTSSSSYVLKASESNLTKNLPTFQGFQTAHGKPLQAPKKSLENVQALFQGDFEELASDFSALGKTEEMSAISDRLSLERPVTQRQAGVSLERTVTQRQAGVSLERPVTQRQAGVILERPVTQRQAGVSLERPVTQRQAGVSLERPVTQRQAGDQDRMHSTAADQDRMHSTAADQDRMHSTAADQDRMHSTAADQDRMHSTAAEHTPSLSERDSGVSLTHTCEKADSFSLMKHSVASPSLGFQTASGKTVDCSVKSTNASEKADSFCTAKDGSASPSLGFQTASGKTVDRSVNSTYASEKTDSFCTAKDGSAGARFGFQTASGKAVAVSETSVEKVKRLFDSDEEDAGDMPKLTLPGLGTDSSFAGFKSAAGGTITVSESSVSSARTVLETGDGIQGHVSRTGSSSSIPRTTPRSRSNLGFQTAGGSSVTVSKKSLDHARQFLDPGEDQQGTAEKERNSDELSTQSTASFQGFQTARGTSVCVSDKALSLNHARKVLRSDEDGSLVEKDSNFEQFQGPVIPAAGAFPGFQPARGTVVSVSESALNHARKALQSFEGQQLVAEKDSDLEQIQKCATPAHRVFPGFQTAGGTGVSVSDKALTHARSLFNSEDVTDESIEKKSVHNTEQEQMILKGAGFQTAGGKKVTVKQSSLSHAKTVFAESETESTSRSGASIPRYNGFQTASGSKLSVSAKLLQHARKVLESTENKSLDQTGDCAVNENNSNDTVCPPQERHLAFQTAGGKSVTVSKNALKNARKVLESAESKRFDQTDDSSLVENKNDDRVKIPQERPLSFQTAGGKSVTVSNNALKNARKVLESAESKRLDQTDDSSLVENKSDDRNKIPQGRPHGFQTAGGKSVTVSENGLKNARKVLESAENESFDETDDSALIKNKRDDMDYPPQGRPLGFQTAGGKSVTVSENALKNARKVLESAENESLDETDDSALVENKSNATHNLPQARPLGFQTAGGKYVTVSENALKNARKVFESAETSNQMTETASENKNVPLLPKSLGFQTAQGASVSVTKKSLQHVQKMLASDQNFEATDSADLDLSKPRMFGFQTARGENVNVSSRSLQHAKSFFKDDTEPQLTSASLDQVASLKMDALAPSIISDHNPVQQATTTGESFPSQPDKFAVKDIPPGNSAKSHQQYQDVSKEPSECEQIVQPMGGQERRGKESFQPIVSDDTEVSMEGVEETEPRCVNTEKVSTTEAQQRVTVKRTALYADTEAVLHDRSAKRFKLQPATAHDMNSPQPSSLQKTPHHLTPKTPTFTKSTIAGNPTPSFQPPYKKPTVTPPTAKKSVDTAGSTPVDKPGFIPPASVAPGFIPPASVAPGLCNTEGSVSVTSSLKDANAEKVEEKSVKEATHSSNGELSREFSKSGERANENLRNMVGHALTANSQQNRSSGQPISKPQAGLKNAPVSDKSQSEESKQQFNQSAVDNGSGFGLEEAMMRQEKIIRQKKRQKVRPLKGRWSIQKSSHRQTKLEDLHLSTKWRNKKQLLNLGVSPAACSVNCRNAEEFRFHLPSFYPGGASSVLIGDSALLIPDRQGYAGKEEFYSAFLTVDGVDPGLVTQEWVSNHYRWIVWKLAAYEVTLPRHFASRALTPDVVMFQLKYRYDREVDACQRSALKRIVERDDTACKRLVLCVSNINNTADSDQKMLEVTDGWYSIRCKPDSALQDLIDRKKLTMGQKIVTTGAELAGSQESCSPLELCTGLHLKVSGNSTRPAPAGAKLGYQRCPTPLCVPLSTLHPQGGLVGCVDLVVVRKYPLVFMEKPPGGGCIFRSADMEEKERRKHEEKRQTVMEKLCSQLQAQMEKEEESAKRGCGKLRLKQQDIQALTTGAEISEAMDGAAHPEELQSMLSGSQFEQWLEYRHKQQEEQQQRLNERLQQAMQQSSQEQRTVVPLQKLRIVGCCRRDVDSKTSMMLTVWRPGPDWDSVLEGKRYCVYSLTAAQSRCRTSGHQVELTAGRQTRLQPVGIEENMLDLLYEPREVYNVTDLQEKTPPHSEFDFVGLVVSVRTALRGSDAVYAVDTKGTVLLIWFWGGLRSFSLHDTLTEGVAFSASNLRLKASSNESVECCASLELSLFSTTGKTPAQRQQLQQFKLTERRAQMLELGRETLANLGSASRPAPAPTSEMFEDLPPSFLEKLMEPLTQESTVVKITAPTTTTTSTYNNNSRTPSKDTFNASTSLNDSLNTTTASCEALSPTSKRKRAAQREKLARLKSYGRAPCLSPLPVNLSPAVSKAFKPLTPHSKQ